MDQGPGVGSVVPAQLPARAAGSQLVEARGCRRVRRDPQVLVRPWRCRVPYRRLSHDREGRGAPRQPPATEDDPWIMQVFGQRPVYNACQPGVHEVLRRWRRIADEYDPPRVLIGETSVDRVEDIVPFYGSGSDELDLAFNFPFFEAPFEAETLSSIAYKFTSLLPADAWPAWTGSNHDISHLATRWAAGDPKLVRLALMMLLTLRGTPVFFEGDEIGLEDSDIERDEVLDPVGLRFWPVYKGRDPERGPIPWKPGPGGGFTKPGYSGHGCPMRDPSLNNIASQRAEPSSVLNFMRDLIALRRSTPDLALGDSVPCRRPTDAGRGRGADLRPSSSTCRTPPQKSSYSQERSVRAPTARREGESGTGPSRSLLGRGLSHLLIARLPLICSVRDMSESATWEPRIDLDEFDLGVHYGLARKRLTALIADVSDPASVPVPACPAWSVHDVLSHLIGIVEEVLAGKLTGPPSKRRLLIRSPGAGASRPQMS